MRDHWMLFCSAVFTWTKLLVVVAELGADERAALDIVPVVTSNLLEEHQVIHNVTLTAHYYLIFKGCSWYCGCC